jgi:hypothetical protein
MNIDTMYDRLEAAGYQGVTDLVIEKCRVDMNAHGDPFYARDHLLGIFRRRLCGCELNEPNHRMVPLLRMWIAEFESIPPETPIYYWEGSFNGSRLAGRSADDRILQVYPQDEQSEN